MTETTERRAMLDALRLDLAARHDGYSIVKADTGANLVMHRGKIAQRYVKRAWAVKFIFSVTPDYPRDVAAALALCLEIARPKAWRVAVRDAYILKNGKLPIVAELLGFYQEKGDLHTVKLISAAEGDTEAEALTRLALAAKGAGAGDE